MMKGRKNGRRKKGKKKKFNGRNKNYFHIATL